MTKRITLYEVARERGEGPLLIRTTEATEAASYVSVKGVRISTRIGPTAELSDFWLNKKGWARTPEEAIANAEAKAIRRLERAESEIAAARASLTALHILKGKP